MSNDTNPNGAYVPEDDAQTPSGPTLPGQDKPASDSIPEDHPGVNLDAPMKCNESGVIENLSQEDIQNGTA